MPQGFIQLKRSPETIELMKDRNAFMLLTQIAYRAKRTNAFSTKNLNIGEALIGDYKNIDLTRGEYRYALKRLEKYQLITTKKTNKGTIAKIINSNIYDINEEENDHQERDISTNRPPSGNHGATTNKNVNNPNKDKINKRKEKSNEFERNSEVKFRKKAFGEKVERGRQTSKYDRIGKELLTGG